MASRHSRGKSTDWCPCRLEDLGSGWRTVRLQTRRGHDELPREGSVVVMTLGRPPRGNPLGFVHDRCSHSCPRT